MRTTHTKTTARVVAAWQAWSGRLAYRQRLADYLTMSDRTSRPAQRYACRVMTDASYHEAIRLRTVWKRIRQTG